MTPDHPDPDASTGPASGDAGSAASVPPVWQRLPPAVRRAVLAGGAVAGALVLIYAALAGGQPRRGSAPPKMGAAPAPRVNPSPRAALAPALDAPAPPVGRILPSP